jgi:hypothetical protein
MFSSTDCAIVAWSHRFDVLWRGWFRRFDPEFIVDDFAGDHILRIERHDAAHDIFEFTHIAGPGVGLEQIQRFAVKPLGVKPLADGMANEMAHQIRNILGAVPQRRNRRAPR